jgi:NAD(P)-dependent dehydrogenase (short-subunit alcohol dehydrogenase family)
VKDQKPTVLLFGGTRGIGGVIAEELRRKHFDVYTVARTPPVKLKEKHFFCDLLREDATKKMMIWIKKNNLRFDGLVFASRDRAKGSAIRLGRRQYRLEIEFPFDFLSEFSRSHKKISAVFLASTASRIVSPEQGDLFHAVKGGLVQMARSIGLRFAKNGGRVNLVSFGAILKPESEKFYTKSKLGTLYKRLYPSGCMVDAKQVASVVSFLLSPDSEGINNQNLLIDYGLESIGQEPLARRFSGLDNLNVKRISRS